MSYSLKILTYFLPIVKHFKMLLLLFPPNHSSFILWISKHFSITNKWGRRKAMLPLCKFNDIAMILITDSVSCSPNEYNNVYIILRKQTGKFQRIRQGTNPQLLQPVPLKKDSWFLLSNSAQALVLLDNMPLQTLHKHTKLFSHAISLFSLCVGWWEASLIYKCP